MNQESPLLEDENIELGTTMVVNTTQRIKKYLENKEGMKEPIRYQRQKIDKNYSKIFLQNVEIITIGNLNKDHQYGLKICGENHDSNVFDLIESKIY